MKREWPLLLTLVFFICQSIDLTSEKFNAWKQDWVQAPCQVNVVVLLLVWNFDDFLLESQQVLDVASLEVFSEELSLVIEASHVL